LHKEWILMKPFTEILNIDLRVPDFWINQCKNIRPVLLQLARLPFLVA